MVDPGDGSAETEPATTQDLARAVDYLRLLLIACLVGIPVSLAAFAFLALLHALEHGVWDGLPHMLGWASPPWWWPLPCLIVAGVAVGAVARWMPGHGGRPPIDGMTLTALPLTHIPGILTASLIGLSLGVVLGPEAPLLALGAGLAVLLARPAGALSGSRFAAVMGAAGAAAAMAVVFGNPLIAAVFMMEAIGLAGRQLTAVVLPCLASAGVGALIFTGLGNWTGLSVEQLALTLPQTHFVLDVADLLWSIPIAVAIALGLKTIHVLARWVAPRVAGRPLLLSTIAALVVGGCAAAYALLSGHNPAEVALSGQYALTAIAAEPQTWSVGALVALLLLKGAAYAISLGAFRGGPIFPAVCLGAAAGVLAAPLPGFGPIPAMAAGMAAATAAAMPVPVSAAVLVVLLLGPAGATVMPIVLLAAVTGFVADQIFERGLTRAGKPTADITASNDS